MENKKIENLLKNKKGITLIALIITVVVMLILAGVTIGAITDKDGIFSKTMEAVESHKNAVQNEKQQIQDIMNEISDAFLGDSTYYDPSGANAPKLVAGMKPVIFSEDGTTLEVKNMSNWYDYSKKQWANAETEDGSLWVWIPRFAYQIHYTNPDNKSAGGTIDVVFLNGTSNEYIKNGVPGTASTTLDTNTYTLHPSFKKAVNEDYSNGEWSEDITGFWVSKFTAGFQQGNAVNTSENDKSKVKRSTISYTTAVAEVTENGQFIGYNVTRNYIDGIYSKNTTGDLADVTAYEMIRDVKIAYPVFKGGYYAMNYISIQDIYNICRALAEPNNMYGFVDSEVDTHLMKNSEWGAVAYLGYSQYGTDGEEVYRNNVNLNDDDNYIYSVTGYTEKEHNINTVNNLQEANIWYTKDGQKGSNNYNITGVYDLNGGAWKIVSAFINNNSENIEIFGDVLLKEITKENGEVSSNKYITLYNCVLPESDVQGEVARQNFHANIDRYGDAVIEVAYDGWTSETGWNNDAGRFMNTRYPFMSRGGRATKPISEGTFTYTAGKGRPYSGDSFRTVLIAK